MPERDGYAHGTPGWIDIGSTDLDRTHAFYGSLFGWERQDAGPVEVTGGYGYYLKDGKMVARYAPAQDPSGGVWWTTYVIVDSAAEVAEQRRQIRAVAPSACGRWVAIAARSS